MRTHIKILLGASSFLALAACERGVLASWNNEAGAFLDEGYFGNATMQNTLVQNGELDFVINLNERFAASVPTTVNFAFNSATLDASAHAILTKQADYIKQFPEISFKVYGHTDLVGSDGYNKSLGLRRANVVVNYLVAQGISRSRLQAVVSYGEEQPLVVTSDRERRNRRTVTEVSGFVKRNPTTMPSEYAQIIHREYIASATAPSDLVNFGESYTNQ